MTYILTMLLLCCQTIIRRVREQWGGVGGQREREREGKMDNQEKDKRIFQIAQLIVSKEREMTMKVENRRILVALLSQHYINILEALWTCSLSPSLLNGTIDGFAVFHE